MKSGLGKAGKVLIKSMGVALKGNSLSGYINKIDNRIDVIKCLARKAAS